MSTRIHAADVIKMQHEALLAQAQSHSEPYVSVEYTDAAKGEVRCVTKVSVPAGYDLQDLAKYAREVAEIASATHEAARLRKPPDDGSPAGASPMPSRAPRTAQRGR